MEEVLNIEQNNVIPWCEEDFLYCLRQRNRLGMVVEYGEEVLGFMIYELHRAKLNVLNLSVHPDYRHQGIGSQMIKKLVGKLSSHKRKCVMFTVRESSLGMQLFLKDQGFRASRVLREEFDDTGEDAYLMQYRYKAPVVLESKCLE